MTKVSINIAVFNGERFLQECLESILHQTMRDFEIVIVDDGSNDRTPEILAEYHQKDQRIKVYTNTKNEGIAFSRNRALSESSSKYIAVMDADDIALPNRLQLQTDFLDDKQDFALVGGGAEIIDVENNVIGKIVASQGTGFLKWLLLFRNPFVHSSIMFRRATISSFGGYNPQYQVAQDYDLYARLSLRYHVENIPSSVVRYRVWGGGISNKSEKVLVSDVENVMCHLFEYYLGEPVSSNMVSQIRKLCWSESGNYSDPIEITHLLRRIYTIYTKSNSLTNRESQEISKHLSYTIYRLANFTSRYSMTTAIKLGVLGFIYNPTTIFSLSKTLLKKLT